MEQYIDFISKNAILSLCFIGIIIAIIASYVKEMTSAVKKVNTQELTLLINREDGQVVDIRALKEFNDGRIAGAIHLNADKAKKGDFVGLDKFKSKPIILVCATGMTVSGIAQSMHKAGFEYVYTLSGGMGSWLNDNLPTTSGK
jgi:rhodanese-related sulfurtransferase